MLRARFVTNALPMQDIRPISEYGPACAGPIPYVITIIREPGRKAILMRHRSRSFLTALVALGAVALSACSGGSSDVVGGTETADGSGGTINLFAYAVPKPGFDKVTAAFAETEEGKGVRFNPSYGASGDQSRRSRTARRPTS